MDNWCFDCKHRRIHETSHEWIECLCKLDSKWHDVYKGCDKYEREDE